MSLKENKHVIKIWEAFDVYPPENGKLERIERVVHVETNLHLDCQHEKHDKTALDKVFSDAAEYVKSPGFFGRVNISGI